MSIVLDANGLVSGLLNPNGKPGRIVDLILSGRIRLLYDDRILAEYQDVLDRPELEIDSSLAQAIIGYIRLSGESITAPPLPEETPPDVDDLPFVEVALTGQAEALVTGNTKHFSGMEKQGVNVLSPSQFIDQITLVDPGVVSRISRAMRT